MDANIESIVNDLKRVSVEKVTFEAITNSIQANATDIKVYFLEKNSSTLEEEQKYFNVDEIKVIDNGDGFNKSNIDSFKIYRSTHKKSLGAKGIGRFLYLKLFKDVNITSLSKNIKFTVQFDVDVKDEKNIYPNTTVHLSNPKDSYQVNKVNYKKQLENHFLPQFKLLNLQDKLIKITVFFNNIKEYIITNSDIPKFEVEEFEIANHIFNLSYLINNNKIQDFDGFYCAGNRVVLKNSQLDYKVRFKSFCGVNILFLLSSQYFDNTVNNERDDFNINPVQTNQDLYNNISWADIQNSLSNKIKEVCFKHGINIDKEAENNLQESINKAPFLVYYLPPNNEYALSSDDLLKKAKKDYEADKEFLRNDKNKLATRYKITLNRVVQSELAEYVFDREKIINKLRDIVSDELKEQEIHNLFMQQRTEDSSQDYRSNHLWLFDDRFMTYDKVFSEAQVNSIFPELNITKRPDILIISNTYTKEAITDIVIIELKRPSDKITPAGAEEQLLEYARYVNSSRQENKIRIWAYAFLKFNADVEDRLKDKSYNYIPTHSTYPIYYYYHAKPNIIINFMDYSALADDAYTRNQTFINILKGKSINLPNK